MKRVFIEYFNLIGFSITGLIFGFTFFIMFINFYHYNNVSDIYIKQDSDFKINSEIKEKLEKTKQNIELFDVNKYNGTENVYSLASIKSRLNTCISKIDSKELDNILSKKEVGIKDIYDMQQFYQINISNECLIKQLYEITSTDSKIKVSNMDTVSIFMQDNIENLIKSTDYLQKVIKSNSNYSFTSDSSKADIYDMTKDSYFDLLNKYKTSIDYIYDVSTWFKEVSK